MLLETSRLTFDRVPVLVGYQDATVLCKKRLDCAVPAATFCT